MTSCNKENNKSDSQSYSQSKRAACDLPEVMNKFIVKHKLGTVPQCPSKTYRGILDVSRRGITGSDCVLSSGWTAWFDGYQGSLTPPGGGEDDDHVRFVGNNYGFSNGAEAKFKKALAEATPQAHSGPNPNGYNTDCSSADNNAATPSTLPSTETEVPAPTDYPAGGTNDETYEPAPSNPDAGMGL